MKTNKGNPPINRQEANYVDKIIKENCANLAPFLYSRVFQTEIYKIENLPEIKQQVTREKEPDFLRIIFNQEYPKGAVLHFEFELKDSPKMDKRMLEYIGILHKKTNKPVIQFVVYLGKGKAKMNTIIKFGQLQYAFTILNIEDFYYKELIDSSNPEEVLLALLASHDDISDEDLLKLILQRFVQLRGKTLETKKYINQLIMLSRVRNLQKTIIKIVKNMNDIGYDITQDDFYLEGIEKGIEQGIEQGIEKGIQIGGEHSRLKLSIIGIQNMTEEKIKKETIARFLELEVSFVNKIQKQLLKKEKLDAALGASSDDIKTLAKKLKVHPILLEVLKEDLEKKKQKKT